MKGYLNGNGYMGLVNGRYILFTSEAEYELAHRRCDDPRMGDAGDLLTAS